MPDTTKKINCIIVDDEPLAQQVIEKFMKRFPELNLVDKCDSAMAAFESLHRQEVDLIFLDINMPVISGLNFLKSLNQPPLVIFTTAYAEYALDGFELNAVDYLLKPISTERFDKAMEKVFERLQRSIPRSPGESRPTGQPSKDYIFVKADGKLVKVNYSDILYCEGMKDYLKIYLKTGKFLVIHQTMKGMEEHLPDQTFMRIHKSYIVSLPAIKSFHDNMLQFAETPEEIPVSNSYKEELLKRL